MVDSAYFDFRGRRYALVYDPVTGEYVAEFTAPGATSWFMPEHLYRGAVTAEVTDVYGDLHSDTKETGVRVLETTPPEIRVTTPEDWQVTANAVSTFRWIVIDDITGIDPETLTLRIDGVEKDGIHIERTPEYFHGNTSFDVVEGRLKMRYPRGTKPDNFFLNKDGHLVLRYESGNRPLLEINNAGHLMEKPESYGKICFCSWTGEIAEGEHIIAFNACDYDMNPADTVTLRYAVLFFIIDRTQADVDLARELNKMVKSGMDVPDWAGNLKGAYNASDMNRVGTGVWYYKNWSANYGYYLNVTARRNWTDADKPTQTDMETYLNDIKEVREKLLFPEYTPHPPESIRFLNWNGANDIERILTDAGYIFPQAKISYFASGEIAAGET